MVANPLQKARETGEKFTVTESTASFLPPANTLHSEAGTNGHHEPPKPPKDYRFAWLGENVRRKDISPLARCLLTWLITSAQWRKDGHMIIGKGEIAERFGIDPRHANRLILELVTGACLRIVQRGGSPKGQRRKANIYCLGSAFEGTPPKARPGARMPLVGNGPGVGLSSDQGLDCHPLPTIPPDNKHTQLFDSAFSKESWVDYCTKKYPDWSHTNIESSYFAALEKDRGKGNWKAYADKCYCLRRNSTRPKLAQTPNGPANQVNGHSPKPPENPIKLGDIIFGGLPSDEHRAKMNGWYGLGGRDNWIKAGRPDLAGKPNAVKDGEVSALIAKYNLGSGGDYQPDADKTVKELVRFTTGAFTEHSKPSFEVFMREAKRLGLGDAKSRSLFQRLEERQWLAKDGRHIGSWKHYLNGVAVNERRQIYA